MLKKIYLSFLGLLTQHTNYGFSHTYSFSAGGRTLDATQEMFAVGTCNIMGSFVRSMPVTGSFTRTAVNNASGVVTTFGGVITGILVLLALTFLTSTFFYIPKATLAAVVICAMFYLFDFEAFIVLWRTKSMLSR